MYHHCLYFSHRVCCVCLGLALMRVWMAYFNSPFVTRGRGCSPPGKLKVGVIRNGIWFHSRNWLIRFRFYWIELCFGILNVSFNSAFIMLSNYSHRIDWNNFHSVFMISIRAVEIAFRGGPDRNRRRAINNSDLGSPDETFQGRTEGLLVGTAAVVGELFVWNT